MSLYKRINQMSEKIDETMKLKDFFREAEVAPDQELKDRELRALGRLMEVVSPNLIEVCDVLKIGKDYIDSFDLDGLPPSITNTEFRGISLLSSVSKTEDESFIIALMSSGDFCKLTFSFNTSLKTYEKFDFKKYEMEDVLKMVPCEEIFTSIEKEIKGFEKRVKESKPKHIQRQEFLVKIGG